MNDPAPATPLEEWLAEENRGSFEHARSVTAHWSKSFYAASRVLPRQRRWATWAVYGFCRHADNLVDLHRPARSHRDLLHELDALRRELVLGYETGESEHPVLRPFLLVAHHYEIPLQLPLELLRGVKMDLEVRRYESFDELYLFAYRVAAVVGLMMSHIFGYRHPIALAYAEQLGVAMQLTNILRDVAEDARRGRIYLPLDEMEKHEVRISDLLAGRGSQQLNKLVAFQAQRTRDYYARGNQGIVLLSPSSRFAVSAASRIYGGILGELADRNYDPMQGRVHVTRRRKLAILGREWLRHQLQAKQDADIEELIRLAPPTLAMQDEDRVSRRSTPRARSVEAALSA